MRSQRIARIGGAAQGEQQRLIQRVGLLPHHRLGKGHETPESAEQRGHPEEQGNFMAAESAQRLNDAKGQAARVVGGDQNRAPSIANALVVSASYGKRSRCSSAPRPLIQRVGSARARHPSVRNTIP